MNAWACSLSSSMVPTTSAAPYAFASGQTRSNFSSPSSRLMELMMLLPWHYVSASSMARGSVVSIITGALILRHQLLVESGSISFSLVAIRGLKADVDNVRAVFHLPAGDFGGFFPLLLGDQILEEARADDVGAFADDQRTVAFFGFHQLDAGIVGAVRARGLRARRFALGHLSDGADVSWRGPAAAADDVQPAVLDEVLQLRGERLRRFEILVVFVRQARRSGNRRRAWKPSRASVRMWSVIKSGPVAQLSPMESRFACETEA